MAHRFSMNVYYEDTDLAGIVYYANYFKFIERARSEALKAVGVDQNELKQREMFFVVRKLEAEFLRAAKLHDHLTVTSSVVKVGGVSINLFQSIYLMKTVIFQCSVKLALVSGLRPIRLSNDLRKSFKKINEFG